MQKAIESGAVPSQFREQPFQQLKGLGIGKLYGFGLLAFAAGSPQGGIPAVSSRARAASTGRE